MSTVAEIPNPLPPTVELANRLTHGLGVLLSIAGTVELVRVTSRYGDSLQTIGVCIYGAALVAVYLASTLSHSFEQPRLRHFFRTVDQVCIFLLIAGTFTPVALTYCRTGWWWALFFAIWASALFGIFAKLFLTRLNNVAVSAYVLMGWLPIVAIKPILATVPTGVMSWIIVGGLFYTLGTIFLMRDERVPYYHAVWHVFVMAGSACHYYAMYAYIVPWPAR